MDTSSTTLHDLASLTPENYRRQQPVSARRSGKSAAIARLTYRGRQVLAPAARKKVRPNTRLKAARHPWADRLHAARTAGFVIEEQGDTTVASCYACGDRFGVAGANTGSAADREVEQDFRDRVYLHQTRQCVTGLFQ